MQPGVASRDGLGGGGDARTEGFGGMLDLGIRRLRRYIGDLVVGAPMRAEDSGGRAGYYPFVS